LIKEKKRLPDQKDRFMKKEPRRKKGRSEMKTEERNRETEKEHKEVKKLGSCRVQKRGKQFQKRKREGKKREKGEGKFRNQKERCKGGDRKSRTQRDTTRKCKWEKITSHLRRENKG
jgi:hypothetical protein